ncbi:hypothetical protein OF001_U10202 [Pseudomonas sp. OF001]|nr:hypothetical protein OF001_U10202 [Pseudomonas sp. OF001]
MPAGAGARRLRARAGRPAGRRCRRRHPARRTGARAGRRQRRQLHLPADRPPRIRLALPRLGHRRHRAGLGAHHRPHQRPRQGHRAAPAGGCPVHLPRPAAGRRALRPEPVQPAVPRLGRRGQRRQPAQVAEPRQARPRPQAAGAQLRRPVQRAVVRGRRDRLRPPDDRREPHGGRPGAVVHLPGVQGRQPAAGRAGAQAMRRRGHPHGGDEPGAEAEPLRRLELPRRRRARRLAGRRAPGGLSHGLHPGRALRVPRGDPQEPLHRPRRPGGQPAGGAGVHRRARRPRRLAQLLGVEVRRAVPLQRRRRTGRQRRPADPRRHRGPGLRPGGGAGDPLVRRHPARHRWSGARLRRQRGEMPAGRRVHRAGRAAAGAVSRAVRRTGADQGTAG